MQFLTLTAFRAPTGVSCASQEINCTRGVGRDKQKSDGQFLLAAIGLLAYANARWDLCLLGRSSIGAVDQNLNMDPNLLDLLGRHAGSE